MGTRWTGPYVKANDFYHTNTKNVMYVNIIINILNMTNQKIIINKFKNAELTLYFEIMVTDKQRDWFNFLTPHGVSYT